MTIQFSTEVNDAIALAATDDEKLDAIETVIGPSAVLEIRTGTQPADCAASSTGSVLARISLASDWADVASAGSKSLAFLPISDSSADNSGEAGHFRLYASNGTTCHSQGSVGTSGSDVVLNTTTFVTGYLFNVTDWTWNSSGGDGEEIADPAGAHFQDAAYLEGTFSGADSSVVAFSFWSNIEEGVSYSPIFIEDPTNNIYNNFGIAIAETQINISAEDDVTVFGGASWQYGGPGTGWHHFMGTVSTNHDAGSKICVLYVDDLLINPSIVADHDAAFTMPLDGMPIGIAALPVFGGSPLTGDMAYMWMKRTTLLSGSTIPEGTRRKFISADGNPIDLGADGSLPTGSAADIYCAGAASTFIVNAGTAGALSITGIGTITDADTPPVATFWEAPVITSNGGGASANISVAENQTAVTTVAGSVMAGKTKTFAFKPNIDDDANNGIFAINSSTGVVTFVSPPDFETPADLDADNIYVGIVTIGDGLTFAEQALSISVTDVAG